MGRLLPGFLGLLASVYILLFHSGEGLEAPAPKEDIKQTLPIIRASKNPLYGKIGLKLERDLFLGNETDESQIFFKSIMPAVDSEGNIYVLDRGNFRVQKFDRGGRFIWSRGRKGEGPGEFRQPTRLIIDPEDHIYIFDTLGPVLIHEYNDSGAFIATSRLALRFSEVQPNGPRTFVAKLFAGREEEPMARLITMSAEGRELKTIAEFPSERPPEIKGHRLSNPYAPRAVQATFPSGGGVCGYSSEYKLLVFDGAGDITTSFECGAPREPITAKEKRDLVDRYLKRQEKLTFGAKLSRHETSRAYELDKYAYHPFFSAVLCDDFDRIYVQRWKLASEADGRQQYDIFSRAGTFLYTTELPFSPRFMRAGHIYASDYNRETGYISLTRYRVANWLEVRAK